MIINVENETYHLIKKTIKGTQWEGKIFVAGGFVRDLILGVPSKDIDIVANEENGGINFANWFCQLHRVYKENSNPIVFERFGTSKLTINGEDIECVAPRHEIYQENSRKPEVSSASLIEDVYRRGETINSLLLNITTDEVLDLTGLGLKDIQNKIIRTPSDPNVTFFDDPLRIMRCVRFQSKYNFTIEEKTLQGIKNNAFRLDQNNIDNPISIERISDELSKILLTDKPSNAFRLMHKCGILKYILPELDNLYGVVQNHFHKYDAFEHTLHVLDAAPNKLTIRLSALFHDIAKPIVKTENETGVHFYNHEFESEKLTKIILKRLKYSNEIINDVCFIVKNHMRTKSFGDDLKNASDKALRKLSDQLGDRLDDCLEVIHADNISHADEHNIPNQVNNIKIKLKELQEKQINNINKNKLPINGNDIIKQFGIKPGIIIKEILDYIREEIYSKPDLTKEEAFNLIENRYSFESLK